MARRSSHYRRFTIPLRQTTFGTTPLGEWSARRREPYLTTHSTHNRKISMPPVGFETTIPERKRPQINALEGAAAGVGALMNITLDTSVPPEQRA
jgi:hypothetical protein